MSLESPIVGADDVERAEGSIVGAKRVGRRDPTGVKERGMYVWGFPRNLGGPAISGQAVPKCEATSTGDGAQGVGAS